MKKICISILTAALFLSLTGCASPFAGKTPPSVDNADTGSASSKAGSEDESYDITVDDIRDSLIPLKIISSCGAFEVRYEIETYDSDPDAAYLITKRFVKDGDLSYYTSSSDLCSGVHKSSYLSNDPEEPYIYQITNGQVERFDRIFAHLNETFESCLFHSYKRGCRIVNVSEADDRYDISMEITEKKQLRSTEQIVFDKSMNRPLSIVSECYDDSGNATSVSFITFTYDSDLRLDETVMAAVSDYQDAHSHHSEDCHEQAREEASAGRTLPSNEQSGNGAGAQTPEPTPPSENTAPSTESLAPSPTPEPENTPAPAVKNHDNCNPYQYDLASTDFYGNTLSNEMLSGARVIMLNFWEPWCGPCVREMPDLEKLYEKYKGQGLVILGAYSTDDPYSIMDIMDSCGTTYPIITYNYEMAGMRTGYVPTTYFFDCERHLIVEEPIIGSKSYSGWDSLIRGLLDIVP